MINVYKYFENLYLYPLYRNMTRLGEYFSKRAINRAAVSRRTGISASRLNELSNNETSYLRATELYLIALAIEVNPSDLLNFICDGLELKD